jgi:hypothetical protein
MSTDVMMQESGVSKRVAVRFEDWPDAERRLAARFMPPAQAVSDPSSA